MRRPRRALRGGPARRGGAIPAADDRRSGACGRRGFAIALLVTEVRQDRVANALPLSPDPQPSQKTFRTKRALAKKMKQNRPLPYWFRFKTDCKIKYNKNRRHWRRTKLGI